MTFRSAPCLALRPAGTRGRGMRPAVAGRWRHEVLAVSSQPDRSCVGPRCRSNFGRLDRSEELVDPACGKRFKSRHPDSLATPQNQRVEQRKWKAEGEEPNPLSSICFRLSPSLPRFGRMASRCAGRLAGSRPNRRTGLPGSSPFQRGATILRDGFLPLIGSGKPSRAPGRLLLRNLR
jgi:hypothetical protein